MQIFDVILFFKLRTIQKKTVKPTYLCLLGARKLAEGKGIVHTINKSPGAEKAPPSDVRSDKSATAPKCLECFSLSLIYD